MVLDKTLTEFFNTVLLYSIYLHRSILRSLMNILRPDDVMNIFSERSSHTVILLLPGTHAEVVFMDTHRWNLSIICFSSLTFKRWLFMQMIIYFWKISSQVLKQVWCGRWISHVLRVRSEIRDRFSRAHKVLQDRETDLLATVQELEEEYTGDVITKQIRQLNLSKDGLVSTLKGNANKEVLDKSTAPIETSILELERKLQNAKDTYKSVTLEWNLELEDTLSVTGDVLLNGVTQTMYDTLRR